MQTLFLMSYGMGRLNKEISLKGTGRMREFISSQNRGNNADFPSLANFIAFWS